MAEMQAAVDVPVIASGGVTTADDVAQLAAAGLAGCIIGRACTRERLKLADALARRDGAELQDSVTQSSMITIADQEESWRRNVEDIRNIAVCGHGSSGKTTLVDQSAREDGRRDGPAQRRRRHQHLRLRRRRKAPQALDRSVGRPLRSRAASAST